MDVAIIRNPDDVVRRAKTGGLSNYDLENIALTLRSPDVDERHVYQLLYALARAGNREYEDLIAGYLDYRRDPQVAALAVSSLCTQWGLTRRYRDHVVAALRGLEWDAMDEVRQAASTAAGEYLRLAEDCEILRELINLAQGDWEDLDRRFAIEALARSLGESHSQAVFPAEASAAESWANHIRQQSIDRMRRDCESEVDRVRVED